MLQQGLLTAFVYLLWLQRNELNVDKNEWASERSI